MKNLLFDKQPTETETETVNASTSSTLDSREGKRVEPLNNGLQNEPKTENVNPPAGLTENRKNVNTFLSKLDTPREPIELHPRLQQNIKKEEPKSEEPKTENLNKGEAPETGLEDSEKKVQGRAYYELQGKSDARITDLVVPKLFAILNGEIDDTKYCVDARSKQVLEQSFIDYRVARAKPQTPAETLTKALIACYAAPLVQSVANKTMQIRANFLEKKAAQQRAELELFNAKNPDKRRPQKVVQVKPSQQKQATEPTTKEEERKTCLNEGCDKSFIKGQGHAKGRNAKNKDAFCCSPCMYQYTSFIGQNSRRKAANKANKPEENK